MALTQQQPEQKWNKHDWVNFTSPDNKKRPSLYSGALNAEAQAICPTAPGRMPCGLIGSRWRGWGVDILKSECKAGGSDLANAVHKIAYASQLLGTELKDGNQILLGTVLEAVLEPESGKLGFYVVKLLDDSLVMVPLGQANIPEEALVPGQTIELVLLSETNLLLDAPRITSIEEAMNAQTQSEARGYWNK